MFKWVLFAIIAVTLLGFSPYLRDDSDMQGWGTPRSGLSIKTDYGTGCQYFVAYGFFGLGAGVTPRLDEFGKPICKDVR